MTDPIRARLLVDLEWPDGRGFPEPHTLAELRHRVAEFIKNSGVPGTPDVTVTESRGFGDETEVRVSPDGRTALLWDHDIANWADLEASGEDTSGNRVFKRATTKEGRNR